MKVNPVKVACWITLWIFLSAILVYLDQNDMDIYFAQVMELTKYYLIWAMVWLGLMKDTDADNIKERIEEEANKMIEQEKEDILASLPNNMK